MTTARVKGRWSGRGDKPLFRTGGRRRSKPVRFGHGLQRDAPLDDDEMVRGVLLVSPQLQKRGQDLRFFERGKWFAQTRAWLAKKKVGVGMVWGYWDKGGHPVGRK